MAARPPAEIFPFTFHRQGFHKVSIVTTHTHQTAPTQFVEANGIRFAYRRFGKATGVPLVFNQHYTGTMDHWDPAVTDSFAREREVIQLLTRSKGNREVAEELGISVRTIETYRARIMLKLSIHSLSELVHYAIRNGIVEP